MKYHTPLILGLTLALASASALSAPRSYVIDPSHTDVIATWNHFGFSNPSLHVGGAKGTIVFDDKAIGKSSVVVELPLSHLNSHVDKLNEHLAGKDFFEKATYPNAVFKSVHVQDLGNGKFDIHGNLTMHGITKPITLNAKLNKAGAHPMTKQPTVGFDATGTIKRSEFGLGMAVPAVSDEVQLRITTEAAVAAKPKKK